MQVLARQQVESENLALRQSLLELQEREQQRIVRDFANVETISQHGSNSRHHMVKYFEKPFHTMVHKSNFLSY
jgi:hypothetical protein